ncbi:DUF4388 domain-containing protein [Deinococcus aquiradiocola]|uniref:PatA-like N-terminal domain-containing protein n=1 Tax=Deinococcus aquiradiocola TaxID=393059 RepID=A0A917UVU4_9DEIO|nr:DUF4388 domain-containing protein [Deinococcus aquiradiocola]GGJ90171.1 hypothetical protein GCM10008939_37600 [Deinococcus aquiradiocola]
MTRSTSSLETFDFLELLYMLAESRRTGVLRVYRDQEFQAWLQDGRVMHVEFGVLRDVSALSALLADPRGRFNFDEGQVHPDPHLDTDMDSLAMEALSELPTPELLLQGPGKITSPERVARMPWSLSQERVLREVETGTPLRELARNPEALEMLSRLARLGLLVARKSRVARLTVAVTRQVKGVAVVDETIIRRWREDLGRHFSHIALRDPQNVVHTLPVTVGSTAGTQLMLPPELLVRTRLHVGDAVLVQPAG